MTEQTYEDQQQEFHRQELGHAMERVDPNWQSTDGYIASDVMRIVDALHGKTSRYALKALAMATNYVECGSVVPLKRCEIGRD